MSTKYNNKNLSHIIYNGVELDHLRYNGVEVFTRYDLPTNFIYVNGSGRLFNNNADLNVDANCMYIIMFLGNKRSDGQEPNLSTNVSSSNSNILFSDYGPMQSNRRQTYLVFIPKLNFTCTVRATNDSQQSAVVILKSDGVMLNDAFSSSDFEFISSHNSNTISQSQNNNWGIGLVGTSWYDTSEPPTTITTNGINLLNEIITGDANAKIRFRFYIIQNASFSVSGSASDSFYPVQNWGGLIIKYK